MKKLLLILFMFNFLFAFDNGTYLKEKKEIENLKKELNDFYTKKEIEYKKRQQELDIVLAKIEAEKKEIEALKNKNEEILKNVEGKVASKTSKIYNSMKPKVAAAIFDKIINEGNISDVFDIIIKLKEKQVMQIMKFLNIDNSAKLTQMLKNFKKNK